MSILCSAIKMSDPHLLKDSSKLCTFNQLQRKRSSLILLCHNHQHDEVESSSSSSSSWLSMKSCDANYVPLTPISFLERAANVFSERTSVIYGPSSVNYTWEHTHIRCLKLASALVHHLDIARGNVVATLAPNVPAIQELHFAVPMAGAVLCTLNTRLDSTMIATLLIHSETKIMFVDQQFLQLAQEALSIIASKNKKTKPPLLVVITSEKSNNPTTNTYEYESLLESGDRDFAIRYPITELDPISINYTSGTTARPKGVIFSHRGAYLNSIATFLIHEMTTLPIYLWTLPTFHCNGWCLVWGLAAVGGANVCLRSVSPKEIFESISLYKVTHMSGAPTIFNMMVNAPSCDQKPLPHKVKIVTGGSPPPPQIISRMEELGFGVNQIYGLTETYGPGTYCAWKPEWDSLPSDERFILKARQGVQHLCIEEVDVRDSITMKKVPADGVTMGEVVLRGNTIMSGYLKDQKATEDAFRGGWFHSGDLAVKHPDGYIEVKDRSKDIIISGGENRSTIEVETVLYSHPAVLEAAVVARPDNHWGQTPCAFVKLKEGFDVSSQGIINFCKDSLPHYMAPRTIIFQDLPKTSTGKIQKSFLREKAKALGSLF